MKNNGNIICEVETMEKLVYSVQEAAEVLGISKSYMYELARRGEVPALKLGKRLVVPKEKFIKWINEEKELGN